MLWASAPAQVFVGCHQWDAQVPGISTCSINFHLGPRTLALILIFAKLEECMLQADGAVLI
jgi:hypothetical protein